MLERRPHSVTILALDGDRVVAVVQPRPGAPDAPTVELPSGWIEPGETPLQAARRELREECSLAAASWRELGSYWAAPSYSTEFVHVFEARELSHDPGQPDPDEDIEVIRLSFAELPGRLSDASSIAAFALFDAGEGDLGARALS